MTTPDDPNWDPSLNPAVRIVSGVFRSRNHIWENDHRIVGRHGLTWTQFTTLLALRFAPDRTLTPTQLYAETQASSGGITKMLHALDQSGMIERIDNPNDGRSRLVRQTDKGARLVEGIVEELMETNSKLFADILTEEECETLAVLIQKLGRGLRDRNWGNAGD